MTNYTIKSLSWLIALCMFQVLILNNLAINSYFYPYVYFFILLYLPLGFNRALLLLLGFCIGLLMDNFLNTFGIHAFACTVIAYIKTPIFSTINTKENPKDDELLSIHLLGQRNFLFFNLSLFLIHHLMVFNLEYFEIGKIIKTLIKSILSGGIALFIIVTLQYVFVKKES